MDKLYRGGYRGSNFLAVQLRRAALLAGVSLAICVGAVGAAEYRAFWVDTWGAGILNQSEVDTLLGVPGTSNGGQIRAANCNGVVIEVRRNCDACYPSSMGEPYMSGLSPANFNALQAVLNAAHDTTGGKKRVEVHCWIVTFRTSGGAVYSQHSDPPTGSLTTLDNYWPSRDDTGAEVSDKAFDPGHPLALQYTVNVAMDLVNNFDIDGIHYDYIRFTANNQGYNPTSVARYNARYGLTGQPAPTDEQFKQWRRDQVSAVVRQVYARIQKSKPWVRQSGSFVTWNPSPVASTRAAFMNTRPYYDVYSDWDSWIQEGIVDMAIPMTYYRQHELPDDYVRWMNFEKDRHGNRHMIIGPGIYLNYLTNAILHLNLTRAPSPAGNYAHGFCGYSQRTPYLNGTWAGFSPSLVSQVTSNSTDIPEMPWKIAPTNGHMMGVVTLAGSGDWADGAVVSINGPLNRSMYVDGTGFYAFIDLPPGSYTVTASKSGFMNAQATVNVAIGAVTGNMYEQNFVLSTGGPPTVNSQPQSLTVAQGSDAIFAVSVSGTTPFSYQWRFNGTNIVGATTNSYTRFNAQSADAGSYSVTVTNSLGSTNSNAATLTVVVPPVITTQPQSQSVTQGVNITFTVAASGTAPFSYRWRFNGTNIAGATQISVARNNVQPADAGSYSVVVSNFAGTATSSNAVLAVYQLPVPPSITTEPVDQEKFVGQTAVFSVLANGATPLAYQWLFKGVPLAGETGSQLTLNQVQTNQVGGYSVVVTNAYGTTNSRVANLVVQPTCVPVGMTPIWSLAPGSRPYLTVSALPYERGMVYNPITQRLLIVSRNGPHVYALNANTGADSHELNISGVSGGTYALLMVGAAADGAVYAGNLTTAGTTTAFKLYRWANDSPTTVPTVAYSGDPGAGNGQRWGDTLDVRGAGTNTQILLASRAGNVVAVLTTANGTTFTSKLITVPDAPAGAFGLGLAFGAGNTFWGKATSQDLRQVGFDLGAGTGSTIRSHAAPDFPAAVAPIGVSLPLNLLGGIKVGVSGNDFRLYNLTPANSPPVALATNSFPTDNENSQTGTGATSFGDTRVYALGANNGLLALEIQCAAPTVPPTIDTHPQSQSVKLGSNATFTVLATGDVPLHYQWQFKGIGIMGATGSSYTRWNVQTSDAGNYTVTVTNVAGVASSQPATLTVMLPQRAHFEAINLLADGRIKLLWTGEPGWSYMLQASTNVSFSDWSTMGPVSGSNGWFAFVDDDATNMERRFYRTQP